MGGHRTACLLPPAFRCYANPLDASSSACISFACRLPSEMALHEDAEQSDAAEVLRLLELGADPDATTEEVGGIIHSFNSNAILPMSERLAVG